MMLMFYLGIILVLQSAYMGFLLYACFEEFSDDRKPIDWILFIFFMSVFSPLVLVVFVLVWLFKGNEFFK